MKKQLLGIKEAAEYVGLSPNYIRRLIGLKEFPYRNISKGERPVFKFEPEELDQWIKTQPGMTTEQILDSELSDL
jgi:excisionase family DNA binding protein